MKVQFLNGGLANQVFQYIFSRFAWFYWQGKEPVYLDDSYFYVEQKHNGYELEKVFGIRPDLLSKHFIGETWDYMIENKQRNVSVCQSLKDAGLDIIMISESNNYTKMNPFTGQVHMIPANEFYPEILDIPGNVYYHGYWINKRWFESYREQLAKELIFPQITDAANKMYEKLILGNKSVGVHIRRGDFVSLGWELPDDYYRKSLESIRRVHPNAVIFVFSDDINWCRVHGEQLGLFGFKEVIYIEGNVGGKNYIDLYLMHLCEGLVISNSSFSYLAALINSRLAFVCNPTKRSI